MIEEHRASVDDDQLLLLSLQISFRNLDSESPRIEPELVHTEHHQKLADVVFGSTDDEAIADLLQGWTSTSDSHEPPPWLDVCARHLVDLRSPSQRLRRLVIRSVGLIGYSGFERVGVDGFVRLLDDLRVSVEDMDETTDWTRLLLDVIKSREGVRRLSPPSWELLAEAAISESPWAPGRTYTPDTTASLEEAEEWEKLRCWIGVVWMLWPPDPGEATEELENVPEEELEGLRAKGLERAVEVEKELVRAMALLSHNQPGAIQNIERRVERWSKERGQDVPESFQRICKQVHEAVQQDEP